MKKINISSKFLFIFLFLLLTIISTPNVFAATLTVNSKLDDGDGTCTVTKCTLKDAVANSNEGDTITFGNLTGTVKVDSEIDIDHSLSIIGPGANDLTLDFKPGGANPYGSLSLNNGKFYGTTINGGANSVGTLFEWDPSTNTITKQFDFNGHPYIYHTAGNLNISGLTITNGDYPIEEYGTGSLNILNTKFINNSDYSPLYIDNSDEGVTLTNVEFTNNTETENNGGGAIYDEGGDLTIINSTFSNNSTVGYGGAIYYDGGGNLTITNSTFAGNTDNGDGSIESYANLTTITNSTFYNTDPNKHNGIYISNDSLITNSIFYNSDCYDITYTSGGHNIDSGHSCGFNQEGDLVNPTEYTKLFDFNSTNGVNPYGSLILNDGKFYGTTQSGGTNDNGTLFEWDPSTNTITKQFDFNSTNGVNPYGSLILNDGKFYGTTQSGGTNDNGTLFEWDPSTNTITKQFSFNFTNGANPYGSIILNDGKFYGTTFNGGVNSYGTLFEWDPSTNTITKQFDFNSTNGVNPHGSLILNDGKFYGTTFNGGVNSYGTLFEWDPSTNTITKQFDFNSTNGANPYGSIILNDGKFYGTTTQGGVNDNGTLFEWDPSTNTITKQFDFNSTNGVNPYGSLILNDGKFYGTTQSGGTNDNGTLFEWDPSTNTITKQFDFNSTNGAYPFGSLILNNGKFYGTTQSGGANSVGTLFEWDLNPTELFDPETILDPYGLKDNGGPVKTIALLLGSPAINTGDDTKAPSTDARGLARVGVSDIGAYEYQGATPIPHKSHIISSGSSPSPVNFVASTPISPTKDDSCLLGFLFSPTTGKPCSIETINSQTPTPPVILQVGPVNARTLKYKMMGDDVKNLQIYLNTHGYPVSITGNGSLNNETTYFGLKTKQAVILFQRAKDLKSDGIVGPKTVKEMN